MSSAEDEGVYRPELPRRVAAACVEELVGTLFLLQVLLGRLLSAGTRASSGGGGGNVGRMSQSVMNFYTDDSPGIKIPPVCPQSRLFVN